MNWIKKRRNELGKKQYEISVLCEVSKNSLINWENGSCNPSEENLVKLKKALEIEV